MKIQPTEKEKDLANKFVAEMKLHGLTPDEMLRIIFLARKKFLILKAQDKN